MVITKAARAAALARQMERVTRRLDALHILSSSFWPIQLAIIFGGVIITIATFGILHGLALLFILLAIIAFFIVHRRHTKVDVSLVRHRVWLQLKQTQLARLHLDWDNIPATPPHDEHEEHPFDTDLDITGTRSLHQLINTCVSFEGSERLREWLLSTTPDKVAIRFRQAIVRELMPLAGFRGKLALNSLYVTRYTAEQWNGEKLVLWLEELREVPTARATLLVHSILSALTLVLIGGYIFLHISLVFCVASLLASLVWFLSRRGTQKNLFQDASSMNQMLGQLRAIFAYLEKYPYAHHQHLRALCEPFQNVDVRPSPLLRQLNILAMMASASNGEGSLFLNALLPWNAYIAYQLNKYKQQAVENLPLWLDTWFELEALCSLANFAYLNPNYILPDIHTDDSPSVHFRAKGLGHPLLKDEIKVANDIAFEKTGDILLITGSNMAGKSTFLRAMGINLCLAYAGTVVNATSLHTSLFEVYTAIKVSDSVTDGYSYFYAEVRRLKALLTRLEQQPAYPLFFLIDEIFKGTNNRERLIGSEAYIYTLADRNCIGAVSTHDLELIRLSEELPQIRNYHFREDVIDGRMVFDYKLRKGPSPTTNALKIMQLEGLPISYKKVTSVHTQS